VTLKKKLTALLREVIIEADVNPAFRERLAQALAPGVKATKKPKAPLREAATPQHKRPSNRRTPAVLDPVQLARDGELSLRAALAKLDIEQLRDVVADYGMDPGKLVMKWRDADRIVDRIVEVARGRAQKGSAFRPPIDGNEHRPADSIGRRPDETEAQRPNEAGSSDGEHYD
jgi:hypothetical protein